MNIEIWTDGSAKGNPGKGGYGIVMKYGDYIKEYSEGFKLTTNNRMELLAVIKSLQKIKRYDIPIVIYSDSKYVVDSINKKWVFNWERNNFIGRKNDDLWREFINVSKPFNLKFVWIKGHANNHYNEICDKLAVNAPATNIDHFFEKNIKKEEK